MITVDINNMEKLYECKFLNSYSPYYVSKDGRVFNKKFEEIKNSKPTKRNNSHRLCYKPIDTVANDRRTINFTKLIYETISNKQLKDNEYIIFKNPNKQNKYAYDNLVVMDDKIDKLLIAQKKRVNNGYESVKKWHQN